jgi:hypothetical protein
MIQNENCCGQVTGQVPPTLAGTSKPNAAAPSGKHWLAGSANILLDFA